MREEKKNIPRDQLANVCCSVFCVTIQLIIFDQCEAQTQFSLTISDHKNSSSTIRLSLLSINVYENYSFCVLMKISEKHKKKSRAHFTNKLLLFLSVFGYLILNEKKKNI
jgi:hypothetical protein